VPGGRRVSRSAFTRVPTDANGDPTQLQGAVGRDVMRVGAWQIDFAVHRQFRSEFFNLFDRVGTNLFQPGLLGKAIGTLSALKLIS
jgi:hypothetical protein